MEEEEEENRVSKKKGRLIMCEEYSNCKKVLR
jgi:hypothetical protein